MQPVTTDARLPRATTKVDEPLRHADDLGLPAVVTRVTAHEDVARANVHQKSGSGLGVSGARFLGRRWNRPQSWSGTRRRLGYAVVRGHLPSPPSSFAASLQLKQLALFARPTGTE